jgi:hypothetical protein
VAADPSLSGSHWSDPVRFAAHGVRLQNMTQSHLEPTKSPPCVDPPSSLPSFSASAVVSFPSTTHDGASDSTSVAHSSSETRLAKQERLRRYGFTINAELKVPICISCCYAVRPQHIDAHLKSQHKHPRRKSPFNFAALCRELGASDDFPTLDLEVVHGVYEGLRVHEGFACKVKSHPLFLIPFKHPPYCMIFSFVHSRVSIASIWVATPVAVISPSQALTSCLIYSNTSAMEDKGIVCSGK